MPLTQWQAQASRLRADTAHRASVLSLFRSSLRECTYLPDAQARVYMKKHIAERYRAYQAPDLSHYAHYNPLQDVQNIIAGPLRMARKGLRWLEKANAGHLDQLTKVLYMTYGRLGKRRYELLRPLLGGPASKSTPKAAKDGEELDANHGQQLSYLHRTLQSRSNPVHPAVFAAIPQMTWPLEVLIKSQIATRPVGTPRSTPRQLSLDLPEKNAWQRPLPQKRVKNIVKAWYGEMTARVLPPLPIGEWKRLQKYAHGSMKWDGPVNRRAMQGAGATTTLRSSMRDTRKASDNKIAIDAHSGEHLISQLGISAPKPPKRFLREATRPHTLTPRLMQHLYQKIFQMCPLLSENEETKTCTVKWGTVGQEHGETKSRRISNKAMMALLEGDENDAAVS